MFYPLFIKLESRTCIVVGGGNVGVRKINDLLQCGAKVRVISPWIAAEIEELAKRGVIEVERRVFHPSDLEGAMLVIAATNDRGVNEDVAQESARRGVLCNVVDQPEQCTAIIPAILKRGRLAIAISTGGASPAMARKIKEDLGSVFGEEYAFALEILAESRKEIIRKVSDAKKRREIFHSLAHSDIIELCKNNEYGRMSEVIRNIAGIEIDLYELGVRSDK